MGSDKDCVSTDDTFVPPIPSLPSRVIMLLVLLLHWGRWFAPILYHVQKFRIESTTATITLVDLVIISITETFAFLSKKTQYITTDWHFKLRKSVLKILMSKRNAMEKKELRLTL